MSQFGSLYSQYYDLLYSDKDYFGEVEYLNKLIKKNSNLANSILDLGCGTGRHASILAELGYKVLGVDSSEDMIKIAKENNKSKNERLSFSRSNIHKLDLGNKFDVVMSLFHVMSYQNSNKELVSAFNIAKKHLNTNGIFIFDFWYGPAVLTNLPTTRVKRFENSNFKITRLAEPHLIPTKNITEVSYDLFIENKNSNEFLKKKETHKMRYFFDTELELIVDKIGFEIEEKFEWMSYNEPDFTSWNVLWVLKNIS